MADVEEQGAKDPVVKPKADKKPTTTKKSTGDFGIARPYAPSTSSRPLSSLDDVTSNTKVDEYLSYSGRMSDTRSFTPTATSELLEKYRSKKPSEEDGQRGRAHTGLTPPIDVESEKYNELISRELAKADPTINHHNQGYSKELADFNRPNSDYPTRTTGDLSQRATPKYTTYGDSEFDRPASVLRPTSALYDSIEPMDYKPLGLNETSYRPITPEHLSSSAPQRVPTRNSHYDPINIPSMIVSKDSGYSHALRPTSPGANSLGYDLDGMSTFDQTPMSTLERPRRYKEPQTSSFSMPANDHLARDNEILRKRVAEKEDEILSLKREIGCFDYPVKETSTTPQYSTMPTSLPTTRGVTFKDSLASPHESTNSNLAANNAAVLEKARQVLSQLDRVTTGGPNIMPRTTQKFPTPSFTMPPVSSISRSTDIYSMPAKRSTTDDKDPFETTSGKIESDWSRTVVGGMPRSIMNKSPYYSAGGHALEDRIQQDYPSETFMERKSTGSLPTVDTSFTPNYDREHLRRVDEVRAAIAAESRKSQRVHRMIDEIQDRQAHRDNPSVPIHSSGLFNERMSPAPIMDTARPPQGFLRPLAVSPRTPFNDYSKNNNNMACQVYALDDEEVGKGRSPRASPLFNDDFSVKDDFVMSGSYYPQGESRWTPMPAVCPKPNVHAKDSSLADFQRKTKELIERQRRISDRILQKFQDLDLILPGAIAAGDDRDGDVDADDHYMPMRQGQAFGQSAWGAQPDPYNVGSSSTLPMYARQDGWKNMAQNPRSSLKRGASLGRSPGPNYNRMSPLVLECEKNGGWR